MRLITASANNYISACLSNNSRSAYKSDLKKFIAWGGSIPCTPEIVANYLSDHAEILSPATLARYLVSINKAHSLHKKVSPTESEIVRATLRGIRRTHGSRQRQVAPLLKSNLIEITSYLTGVKGLRDKALLLIGFAGGFRRSELVNIRFEDLKFVEEGLIIKLHISKNDQSGMGRNVAIPFARGDLCPVKSLRAWLQESGIDSGHIFRSVNKVGRVSEKQLSTNAVAIIIKKRVAQIGLTAKNFSGHSLRSGLVTSAAQAGVSLWKIKLQTGHKSDFMLYRYIRDGRLFIDNAAGAIL